MRDAAYSLAPTIGSTRRKLTIPAFAYASTWAGVSLLLARYSIGNTNPFSFRRPIIQPNNTFVAAVSWTDSPYVYRYKFVEGVGEVLYFPVYRDQQIGPGAYLEIWSVSEEALSYTDGDWTLRASRLVLPTLCAPCQENEETVTGVSEPLSSLPPYQYCNPFCTPLCAPVTGSEAYSMIRWGTSTSLILDAAGIVLLENSLNSTSVARTYGFTLASTEKYCYLAWPDSLYPRPIADTGFSIGGWPMTNDLAGAAEGYNLTHNGWPYTLVAVGGVNYRLYRTKYPQGLSFAITVTTS